MNHLKDRGLFLILVSSVKSNNYHQITENGIKSTHSSHRKNISVFLKFGTVVKPEINISDKGRYFHSGTN